MSESQPPARRIRAGDQEREALLNILDQAYADGRLDADELRERQGKALQLRFTDEMADLVSDLPEGQDVDPGTTVAPRPSAPPATAPAEYGASVTIMTGKSVTLPAGTEHMSNFAWWGGDDIDCTEALGPGRTLTLELNAIMAGHNIYVPEGVRVLDEAIAIMAGNDIHKGAQGDGSNGTLIIKGFLWWAGSDIFLAGSKKDKRR